MKQFWKRIIFSLFLLFTVPAYAKDAEASIEPTLEELIERRWKELSYAEMANDVSAMNQVGKYFLGLADFERFRDLSLMARMRVVFAMRCLTECVDDERAMEFLLELASPDKFDQLEEYDNKLLNEQFKLLLSRGKLDKITASEYLKFAKPVQVGLIERQKLTALLKGDEKALNFFVDHLISEYPESAQKYGQTFLVDFVKSVLPCMNLTDGTRSFYYLFENGDILRIYSNPDFVSVTKDMGEVERFSLMSIVKNNLERFGCHVTDKSISDAFIMLYKHRIKLSKNKIYGGDFNPHLIMVCHKDPEFDLNRDIEFAERFDVTNISPFKGRTDIKGIHDSILKTRGDMVVNFDAHGNPRGIILDKEETAEETIFYEIKVEELTASMLKHAGNNDGKLSNSILILDTCFSGNLAIKFYNKIYELAKEKDVNLKDFSAVIATANRDEVGWVGNKTGTIFRDTLNKTVKGDVLTFGDVFNVEAGTKSVDSNGGLVWYNTKDVRDDFAVFLPVSSKEFKEFKKKLKPYRKKKTEKSDYEEEKINPDIPVLELG
jgi:hypothetical protein